MLKTKLKTLLKSQKGSSGIVIGLIFAAILTIAVLSTQPTVQSTFTSIATKTQTYFTKQIDDTYK